MTLNSSQTDSGAEPRAEASGADRRVYARLPFRGTDFGGLGHMSTRLWAFLDWPVLTVRT